MIRVIFLGKVSYLSPYFIASIDQGQNEKDPDYCLITMSDGRMYGCSGKNAAEVSKEMERFFDGLPRSSI